MCEAQVDFEWTLRVKMLRCSCGKECVGTAVLSFLGFFSVSPMNIRGYDSIFASTIFIKRLMLITLLVVVLIYDIKRDAVIACFLFFRFHILFCQFLISPRHVLREFEEIVRPFGRFFFYKIMCCLILQMDLIAGQTVLSSITIDMKLLEKIDCC